LAFPVCAQPQGAPDSSHPAPLSRQELLGCVERGDGLTSLKGAFESRVVQHNSDGEALDAEARSIEAENKSSVANQGAIAQRVAAYNRRQAGHRANGEVLRAEESRLRDEVDRFNGTCGSRPYLERDKQWAEREYQGRLAAAAAAAPFATGVKAYEQGNYQEALAAWLPLAEQGRASAQFNVAVMYERGHGVARNDVEAARWYLAAATGGDVAAQLKMGTLYETGIGMAKDIGSASFWYGEASRGGDKDAAAAREARERLAKLPKEFQSGAEEVAAFEGGRFVLRRAVDKQCVVALQGTVTPSAEGEFERMLKKAKAQGCTRPLTLLLESPGGRYEAGLALARSVRLEQMRTVVRYGCASSCATIFLAGTERLLWGSQAEIGFHQISRVKEGEAMDSGTCIASNFDPNAVALRRYLQFVIPETAEQIFAIAMATPCKSIEWVKGKRAIDLQVATRLEAEGKDVFGPLQERMETSARTR
jgi:TPR repeat protein